MSDVEDVLVEEFEKYLRLMTAHMKSSAESKRLGDELSQAKKRVIRGLQTAKIPFVLALEHKGVLTAIESLKCQDTRKAAGILVEAKATAFLQVNTSAIKSKFSSGNTGGIPEEVVALYKKVQSGYELLVTSVVDPFEAM